MIRWAAALLLVAALAPGTATAHWRSTGAGSGLAPTATMPTGATPTASVTARTVTVSFLQNAFVGSTIGGRGGSYILKRYAEGSPTAVTPAGSCATVTGTSATLTCTEAGLPYGRWQYRVTPIIDSFLGAQGQRSAVAAVVLSTPVLQSVTPQNPPSGATTGVISVSWSTSPNATGYDVFRREAGGAFPTSPLNGAAPVAATTFTDTTGASGISYEYAVTAVDSGPPRLDSPRSNVLAARVTTRPSAPGGAVTAVPGSGGSISTSWSGVAEATGYNVYRRVPGGSYDYSAPVNGTTPVTATSFADPTASPGVDYVYVVRSVVPGTAGTQVQSGDSAESTAASCSSTYRTFVSGTAGLTHDFRLGEAAGTTAVNEANPMGNGSFGGGVSLGQTGAIACDANTAVAFDGTTGYLAPAASTPAVAAPSTFTIEVWFKTTVGGGKLVGFGNQRTTLSNSYDRHLYLTNAGNLVFGVYPSAAKTVASPATYADGRWHLATATLGAAGLRLHVDGVEVAADPAVTTAQAYMGYWRAGWDNVSGWPTSPSRAFFGGTLDELAIISTQLPAATVAERYAAGRP